MVYSIRHEFLVVEQPLNSIEMQLFLPMRAQPLLHKQTHLAWYASISACRGYSRAGMTVIISHRHPPWPFLLIQKPVISVGVSSSIPVEFVHNLQLKPGLQQQGHIFQLWHTTNIYRNSLHGLGSFQGFSGQQLLWKYSIPTIGIFIK